MNYLAHFYLSFNDADLLTGNFIADHIKGKAYLNYTPQVQRGILLHRSIDTFTDEHDVVLKSKQRLFTKYHHYSAVIVDMFYDHLLAKNWKIYSSINLKKFTSNCYRTLISRKELPPKAAFMLNYMAEQDWLGNYASQEGINRSLTGLSNRTHFESKMEHASNDLFEDYQKYQSEFTLFFPELVQHSKNWLKENSL